MISVVKNDIKYLLQTIRAPSTRRCQAWQNAKSAERASFSDAPFLTLTVRQTEHGSPTFVRLRPL